MEPDRCCQGKEAEWRLCCRSHQTPEILSTCPHPFPFQTHKMCYRNKKSVTTPCCHGDTALVWQPYYIRVMFMGHQQTRLMFCECKCFGGGSELMCASILPHLGLVNRQWITASCADVTLNTTCYFCACIVCCKDEMLTALPLCMTGVAANTNVNPKFSVLWQGGQQRQTLLPLVNSTSSFKGVLRCSQASWEIWSV